MIAKSMKKFTANSSAIRAMFEEGKNMAEKVGAENVYDFSLGNPNVPAPKAFKEAIIDLAKNTNPVKLNGYSSNAGIPEVRRAVAEHVNKVQGTDFTEENFIMTVGAAGAINVALKTILDPEDEVIAFAPYFVEYGGYVSNYSGVLKVVPANLKDFQADVEALEETITPKTRALIINSPHNPTGVIYSEETIKKIVAVIEKKEKEFGSEIFIIADEPYRELAYDGIKVPYLTKYYDKTLVCYSWSKSLSLPGERIGYLMIPSTIPDFDETLNAATVANRVMGFVNAPTLLQLAVARCVDEQTDIGYYDRNRQDLYNGLTKIGYDCVFPQGAFYLWIKSPLEDEKEFCKVCKKYYALVVPGSSFACPGYVRASYCVSHETVINSLPAFEKAFADCKDKK